MTAEPIQLGDLSESRSFTHSATVQLPSSHVLHPNACNPCMDLVVLVAEPNEDEDAVGTRRGSTRKTTRPGASVTTSISLWRLAGSKVWEMEVNGRVLGLAWSPDGLFLSVLILRLSAWPPGEAGPDTAQSTIEHLSVHTGEVVKSVSPPPSLWDSLCSADWAPSSERSSRFQWWPMSWQPAESDWPSPKPGAPLTIIESLPHLTPVEPPKPAIINPFAKPSAAEAQKTKGLHEKLVKAPGLLPSNPLVKPDVLVASAPIRKQNLRPKAVSFLTGTFVLPAETPKDVPSSVLELARRADAVTILLDTVFRGLDSSAAAFKDADKQTFRWYDELESCGINHGMSPVDVNADLFCFLMTGHCGQAVSDWFGTRLTNRPVLKWDQAVQTAFIDIQKILVESVVPAVERILLILEELNGWAHDLLQFEVILDGDAITKAMALARGLLFLFEDMRQSANLERQSAVEFFKWLRYEMLRTSNDETLIYPIHDLKLVWSYLKNGFVESRFKRHFPNVPGATHDVLPTGVPRKGTDSKPSLESVISATLSTLSAPRRPTELLSSPPPTVPEPSFSSSYASPRATKSPEVVSSPDTVGDRTMDDGNAEEDVDVVRDLEMEPWAWANSLLVAFGDIIRTARPRRPVPEPGGDWAVEAIPEGSLLSERICDGVRWIFHSSTEGTLDSLCYDPTDGDIVKFGRHRVPEGEVVQAAFFDDEEAVVVFSRGGQRHLAAVSMSSLEAQLRPLTLGNISEVAVSLHTMVPEQLHITRSRPLGPSRRMASAESWTLAVNGREGRRSGWVLKRAGCELEIFDMDVNEDEPDNDDEAEDEGMETE